MLIQVVYKGIKYTRDVRVYDNRDGSWGFSVGKMTGIWRKGFIEPMIYLSGYSYREIKRYRPLIIEFLIAYKIAVRSTKPAPLFVEETKYEELDSASDKRHSEIKPLVAAGLALWMTNAKEWTPCYHRTGPNKGEVWYFRRTRFSKEDIDDIKRYLPYCCKCGYRVECGKPCSNPQQKSEEEIFEDIENTIRGDKNEVLCCQEG